MPINSIKEVLEEIKLDLVDFFQTKGDLLELKIAEKGSPILAKGIHGGILIILLIIDFAITLLTAIFALALIFIESDTQGFDIVRSMTFGGLCLLGLFLLLTIIMLCLKKSMTGKIKRQVLTKIIDQQEERERNKAMRVPSADITETEHLSTNGTIRLEK